MGGGGGGGGEEWGTKCADWTNVDIVIARNYIQQKETGFLYLQ